MCIRDRSDPEGFADNLFDLEIMRQKRLHKSEAYSHERKPYEEKSDRCVLTIHLPE